MLIYHGDPFGSEVSFWACLSDRDNLVHFMSFTEPPFIPLVVCFVCDWENLKKKVRDKKYAIRSHDLRWCTMGIPSLRWCSQRRGHPCQVSVFKSRQRKERDLFSRVTPGGKAAAANVRAGDYLLAVNMQNLEDASLLNVMELIKGNRGTRFQQVEH